MRINSGEKERFETYQSQGENLTTEKIVNDSGGLTTIKEFFNEDYNNTLSQFGSSPSKFHLEQEIITEKKIKSKYGLSKDFIFEDSSDDTKKATNINDKPKDKLIINTKSIYYPNSSFGSLDNNTAMNNEQNKNQSSINKVTEVGVINNTSEASHIIKSPKKPKIKQKDNTMRALKQFKSLIVPRQIGLQAFRYIKDLGSYENPKNNYVKMNNSFFASKQKYLLKQVAKQKNYLDNCVKTIIEYKNRCKNTIFNFLDDHIKIFDPLNNKKIIFDVILIFATMIAAFCKTIEVSFSIDFDVVYSDVYPIIQIIIFTLFLLDILINFNTGIYKKGTISYKRQDVYRLYKKDRFIYDVISVFSFLEITEKFPAVSNLLKLLIFFKIPLVSQKLEMAQQIAHADNKKAKLYCIIQLLRLVITIFFVAHCVAIVYFGQIVFSNYLKIDNQVNWVNQSSYITMDDVWYKKYIFSLYFSVTTMMTVGYGDITPKNMYIRFQNKNIFEINQFISKRNEAIIAIISMVIACGVFAYSFNLIGNIISEMNKKDEVFKAQMKKVHIYLSDRNIDKDLKYQVLKHLEYKYKHDHTLSKEEEDAVLSGLSANLLQKIEFQTKSMIFNKANNIFQTFSRDIRNQLCLKLKEIRTNKEEIIFEQGSMSDNPEMYFIHRGLIEIYFKSKNIKKPKESILNVLKDSQYFGEMSFLTNKPRICTARAKESSIIFSLSRQDFLSVLENNKEQLEKYHLIYSKLIFGESNSIISSQCYYCKKTTHMTNSCPSIHFSPDKQLVILKANYSTPIEERDYFPRKRRKTRALEEVFNLKQMIKSVKKRNKSIFKQNEELFQRQLTQFQKLNSIQSQGSLIKGDIDLIYKIREMYKNNELNLSEDQSVTSCTSQEDSEFSSSSNSEKQGKRQTVLSSQQENYQYQYQARHTVITKQKSILTNNNYPTSDSLFTKNKTDSINSINTIPDEEDQVEKSKQGTLEMIEGDQNNELKDQDKVVTKVRSHIFKSKKNDSENIRSSEKKQVTFLKKNQNEKTEKSPSNQVKKQILYQGNTQQGSFGEEVEKIGKSRKKRTQIGLHRYQSNENQESNNSGSLIQLDQIQSPKNQIKQIQDQSEVHQRQERSLKKLTQFSTAYNTQRSQKRQTQIQGQALNKQQSLYMKGLTMNSEYNNQNESEDDFIMDKMREYKYYFPFFNYKNIIQIYNRTKTIQNSKLPSYLNVYSFYNRKIIKVNRQKQSYLTLKKQIQESK